MRIYGHTAIEMIEEFPGIGTLNKLADPFEGALLNIDINYAREVACEDGSLIYMDVEIKA